MAAFCRPGVLHRFLPSGAPERIFADHALNARLERQTSRDTTTGPARRRGQRGATVADTTA